MKNNLKRVFSLVLALMLCMTFIPTNTASAKTFKDVPKSHWAYNYINEMSNQGYISGYPNGTFKPQANIKFLEALRFAAILTQYDQNALVAAKQVWQNQVAALGVPDWAQDNVIKCLAKGVIKMDTLEAAKKYKMFDANSRGVSRVNLAEYFAKAMSIKSNDPVISLPYKDVNNIKAIYRPYIAALIDAGVLSAQGNGDGKFSGDSPVKRDQVARMVYAALKYQAANANQNNPVNPVNPANPVNPVNPVNPANQAPITVTGTVIEMSTTGTTAILSVKDASGTGKVFSLNAGTIVTVDGKLGSFANILAGQTVTVTAKPSIPVMQALSIEAKGVQFSLEGEVTNVDNDNKEIKISYTDNNRNKVSKVFKVDSSSSITINNKSRSLYDVKSGSQVKGTIYNDTVKTLEVTSSSDDYKGYVKRVDYREITIVSLNGRENRYKLPRDERDFDVYDERDTRGYRRDRKSSLRELMSLVNSNTSVYVEIETDSRNDDEVSYISIGDGFENEYIVESNYERRRDRRDNELVLYPKGSYDSRRYRETYYYDSDLRADTFDSRRDVRVRDIGPGSRVVILEKDKDTIKKIMVIDSRYNNGYGYSNDWVRATVNYIDSSTIIATDYYNSKTSYTIDVNGRSISSISKGSPYYFRLSDKNDRFPKLIEYSYTEPNNYSYNRSGYKTVNVYEARVSGDIIRLFESKDDKGYYIDSNTKIENNYTFYELTRKDESFFRRANVQIIADIYGHVDYLSIR